MARSFPRDRSPRPRNKANPRSTSRADDPLALQLPLVSGRWLLWSLLGVFGGGLALVYLTVCLLFWQGQWQILFHPAHPPAQDPPGVEDVRFGTSEAGQTRLHGWLLNAQPGTPAAGFTILYLHAMTIGSLSGTATDLEALHSLGVNLFAFDYSGFGESQDVRPNEQRASADTEAAWQYLTGTLHVPPASVVLYGEGLGASLAADAAARHPDTAGLVLDAPSPTALQIFRADPISRWIPLWLLVHDRFDPRASLKSAKQPKLFLLPDTAEQAGSHYALLAASPKRVVRLPAGQQASRFRLDALRSFLSQLPPPTR